MSRKGKQFRRRRESSSDAEDDEQSKEDIRTALQETKEAQKFRQRPHGVSAVALAIGKKISKSDELTNYDPFKLKTGGIIDLKEIKDRNRDRSDEDTRDVSNMGSTFAAETNRRDEDAEMDFDKMNYVWGIVILPCLLHLYTAKKTGMKYIEVEMEKKKGIPKAEEQKKAGDKYKSEEDKLYELPDHLQVESQKSSEEMLSNQMLSGIPEVDLGIEAKILNIEATEEAKQKHIQERRNTKKNTTSFVPTNMAVNYVQHKRYMHEDHSQPKKRHVKEEPPKPRPLVVGDADKPGGPAPAPLSQKRGLQTEKATDDFHYERFKKQLRRY